MTSDELRFAWCAERLAGNWSTSLRPWAWVEPEYDVLTIGERARDGEWRPWYHEEIPRQDATEVTLDDLRELAREAYGAGFSAYENGCEVYVCAPASLNAAFVWALDPATSRAALAAALRVVIERKGKR